MSRWLALAQRHFTVPKGPKWPKPAWDRSPDKGPELPRPDPRVCRETQNDRFYASEFSTLLQRNPTLDPARWRVACYDAARFLLAWGRAADGLG